MYSPYVFLVDSHSPSTGSVPLPNRSQEVKASVCLDHDCSPATSLGAVPKTLVFENQLYTLQKLRFTSNYPSQNTDPRINVPISCLSRYKVFEVNLVGAAGAGVVDVGKPLQFRGTSASS